MRRAVGAIILVLGIGMMALAVAHFAIGVGVDGDGVAIWFAIGAMLTTTGILVRH